MTDTACGDAARSGAPGLQDLRQYRIPPHLSGDARIACFASASIVVDGSRVARADPQPTPAELANFYTNDYRKVMGKAHALEAYQGSPNYRAQVRSQVDWLEECGVARGRFLDAGAGFGLLLSEIRDRLPEMSRFAVEPDSDAGDVLTDLATLERDFERFWSGSAFDAGSFDAIVLSHVIEHLPAPANALATLREYLRPGGYLLVEAPNDTRDALMDPRRSSDLPHLWFFSTDSLSSTVQEAGLEVRRAGPVGLCRPGTRVPLIRRIRRAATRRLWGPLALLTDPGWYGEGEDRCDCRVLAQKPAGS